MNDSFEPMQYALADEDLEAALIGEIGPESPLARSNPVAGFFVEARDLSNHQPVEPSPQLSALFAGGHVAISAEVPTQIETAVGPDAWSPNSAPVSSPSRNGNHYGRPVHREDVAAAAPVSVPLEEPTHGFDEEPYGLEAPVAPAYHYQPVYRTSVFETLRGLLAPSATKALMVFTGVVLLAAVGHAAGAITLPLPGGSNDQTVAGIVPGDGIVPTSQITGVDTTIAGAGSPGEVTSIPGLSTPEVTPPPITAALRTTAVTTASASTTETSVEETTTPTQPSTTTEVTTATSETTATTATTVPITIVETTLGATTTAVNTTDTEPVSTTAPPAVITISPNVLYKVPGDLPAGRFTGVRGPGPAGCSITTTNAVGTPSSTVYDQGAIVTVTLQSGGSVITGLGCPQAFRAS